MTESGAYKNDALQYSSKEQSNASAYSRIISDRTPCAYTQLLGASGEDMGKIDFFCTPIGIVIKANLKNLDACKGNDEAFFLKINGKRQLDPNREITCDTKKLYSGSSYRVKTSYLPPLYASKGCGSLTFMTHDFSVSEIAGRKVNVMATDNLVIASGDILLKHK